jgi:alkylated DNA repair dioxygenase AlkB
VPNPTVHQCADRLNAQFSGDEAGPLRSVGMCLYRDGRDSVAWHGDSIGHQASTPSTLVAIVSLGARRRFLLRPSSGGGSRRFDLGEGDLLVMGGTCQRTWQHAVTKSNRPVGPRISVQFRSTGVT